MCFRGQPLYLKRMILRFAEILITGLFLSYGFHKKKFFGFYSEEVHKLDSGNIGHFENFNIFC